MIGTIPTKPDGTEPKGFDCNGRVSLVAAQKMRAGGYDFAMRYVRCTRYNDYDVSPNEIANLLRAELAVGLVQHVPLPGWSPTARKGKLYGEIAAEEAGTAGYALGAQLWCDLEEVSSTSTSADVIGYCNAWHEAVHAAGYVTGLYVGWECGLTPTELYRALRFSAYWKGYNVAIVDEPIVRGCQLRQREARATDLPAGVVLPEFDVDRIRTDAKGGRPVFMLPRPLLA